jgi:hypothetical protein
MAKNEKQKIKYDIHNDYRFPIELIHKAYKILQKHGDESFHRYCEKVDMPMQDRERVFNKHAYDNDPAFKVKIDEKIKVIKEKIGVRIKI